MSRLIFYFLCCVLGVAAQPAFPPGVSDAMSSMNEDMKQVDTANPTEDAILSSLKEHATQALEADLLDSASELGLAQAAYVATRARLAKMIYTGGCPRDLTAKCPSGWSETNSACEPPADYEGRCGATSFSDLATAGSKEEFSWKCRAAWPCQATCVKDFSKCPESWSITGSLCVAPDTYDGICSPAFDFSSYNDREKIRWSAMCGSQWPCS